MDNKYYVIVAGNGTTSRANLEALLEDHFYANGANGILVLPYKDKPSQGQIFAAQLAKDKNKDIVIYTKSDNFSNLPTATVIDTPISADDFFKTLTTEKACALLLWDDEDVEGHNYFVALTEAGIPCFDLTDGLNKITSSVGDVTIEEPSVPAQEQITAEEEEEDDGEDEEEEDDFEDDGEDDEEEENEVLEDIYFGIQAIAKIFAKALIEEMGNIRPLEVPEVTPEDAPKKPSKGSKA
jgi:hypothetical protein